MHAGRGTDLGPVVIGNRSSAVGEEDKILYCAPERLPARPAFSSVFFRWPFSRKFRVALGDHGVVVWRVLLAEWRDRRMIRSPGLLLL